MPSKKIDITSKFSIELQDISNKLKQLENGRIYEISGAQMDGYLATNISQLKKMLAHLIYKIEYGTDSITDDLSELLDKIKL
ncbi:MAG TPA: hypothetical protein DEF34_10315 [Desulfotomaculum sp.]|nr:MAG: hypothetical protein JL56_05740 [Desulfotomaculum sp. BICA1-6]HBX24008.1 hypothetical protein [Desulfotomaculum sp.]